MAAASDDSDTNGNGSGGSKPITSASQKIDSPSPLAARGGRLAEGELPRADKESPDIFGHPVPSGAAKKMSEVLGEVVWLMSQSPAHKQYFISDLEWFVMTPVLLQQFRLYYAKDRPLGCLFWARVSDEVEAMLKAGATKVRPQDWKSGPKLWVIEVVAPFGGAEEMVNDLKAKVFPDEEITYLAVGAGGKRELKSV